MLSIIIPIYNEEPSIEKFFEQLIDTIQHPDLISDIIFVDGNSTDRSFVVLQEQLEKYTGSISLHLLKTKKGRSGQLNHGAAHAQGTFFFFLHADCMPEQGFEQKILTYGIQKNTGGVCRFHTVPAKRWNRCIDYLYNRKWLFRCRFGDSGIITSKKIFDDIGGFDEKYGIEEDHVFIMQLWKKGQFAIFPIEIYVSDRLFSHNGFIKTFITYCIVHILFLIGVSQKHLLSLLSFLKGVKN